MESKLILISFAELAGKLAICGMLFTLYVGTGHAQQLELSGAGPSSYSLSAQGPVPTSANANSFSTGPATLNQNTGTSSIFTAHIPATSMAVSFSNQQYTSSAYPGLHMGGLAVGDNTNTMAGTNVFVRMDNIGSPLSNMFTSAPDIATAGTNIDAFGSSSSSNNATNYAFRINTDAFYQVGQLPGARNYYGDVTITFSRPVLNPVLHFSAFGGSIKQSVAGETIGFYTELELSNTDVSAGRTLTRLSGSTHFVLDATSTKILNNATAKDNDDSGLYASTQENASAGSVLLNSGSVPVTSVTFRVYLRGDGGTDPSAVWGSPGSSQGRVPDTWLLAASLGMYNISGNVFNDITADNTVNGVGTNAGGLFANLVDATGNVYASTPVAANGTYSFSNIETSTYNIILTTTAGTVGSPLSTATLPSGYTSVGEHVGTGSGTDGSPNSVLAVVVANANVTNANFGIVQCTQSAPVVGAITQPTCAVATGTVELGGLPASGTWTVTVSPVVAGATGTTGSGTTTTIGALPAGTYTFTTVTALGCNTSASTPATLNTPVCLSISGTVFDDANGLFGTPANTVDGLAVQTASGSQLYANLFTNAGVFISSLPIDAGGNYTFTGLAASTSYQITVSSAPAGAGSTPVPSTGLPAGWMYTGETADGSGMGSDGIINGVAVVALGTTNLQNINFGIEQLPDSDNKSGTLAGQPSVNQFVTLDGTVFGAPPLSGSDPEDQPASGGLAGKSVTITSLPTHGELWYAGVQITAPQTVISGFDPSLLQIRLTGAGYTSTSFTYAYVDAAQLQDSSPATYTLSWGGPLPVQLVDFNAAKEGTTVILSWSTTEETSSDHFDIQRSADGQNWVRIGAVIAAGDSRMKLDYHFTDTAPLGGSNLYRLKMIDIDNTYAFSTIKEIGFPAAEEARIWPNPAHDFVKVSLPGNEKISGATMFDLAGRVVLQVNEPRDGKISTGSLAPGLYVIQLKTPGGRLFQYKLLIAK